MWIVIGAIALFIVYLVVKKNLNKDGFSTTEPVEKEISLDETPKEVEKETTVAAPAEPEPIKEEPKAAPAAKKPAATKKPAAKKPEPKVEDTSEYGSQFSGLSGTYKQSKEFSLFDTKAAFFWNEGDATVTLLSITAFVKGEAKSTSYATYTFNVKDWAWEGDQPKGSATEIKKHLSENFKKGETA